MNEVWVTGAHKATSIQLTNRVTILIGKRNRKPEKIWFFYIPGENEWTVILKSSLDMHLASMIMIRVKTSFDLLVKPEQL